MKTPEQLALEYIKDVETARNPSVTATAFPQMQRCFLAGYQAAKDQFADTSKVMNSSNNSNGWISVKEQNPEARKIVLVCHKTFGVQMGFIDDNHARPCRNRWIVYVREFEEAAGNHIPKTGKYEHIEITHWMELPNPPEDE